MSKLIAILAEYQSGTKSLCFNDGFRRIEVDGQIQFKRFWALPESNAYSQRVICSIECVSKIVFVEKWLAIYIYQHCCSECKQASYKYPSQQLWESCISLDCTWKTVICNGQTIAQCNCYRFFSRCHLEEHLILFHAICLFFEPLPCIYWKNETKWSSSSCHF